MVILIKADIDNIDNWKLLLLSAKHCAGNISLTPHNHPTGRPSYFSHFPDEEFCLKPQGRWPAEVALSWGGCWSLGEAVTGAGAVTMAGVRGDYAPPLTSGTSGQPLGLCLPTDEMETVTPTSWRCYKDAIKGGKQSLWHLGHTQ